MIFYLFRHPPKAERAETAVWLSQLRKYTGYEPAKNPIIFYKA
jgi:hypothetical protein